MNNFEGLVGLTIVSFEYSDEYYPDSLTFTTNNGRTFGWLYKTDTSSVEDFDPAEFNKVLNSPLISAFYYEEDIPEDEDAYCPCCAIRHYSLWTFATNHACVTVTLTPASFVEITPFAVGQIVERYNEYEENEHTKGIVGKVTSTSDGINSIAVVDWGNETRNEHKWNITQVKDW
jgi:hypothetical protein